MHLINVNKAAKYLAKHIFMITDKLAIGGGCVLRASEEQLFKLRCKLEVPEMGKWYRREKNETIEVENYNGNRMAFLYHSIIESAAHSMENTRLNDGCYQYFSIQDKYEYYPLVLDLTDVLIAPERWELDDSETYFIVDGVHVFQTRKCMLEPNGYLKETDLYGEDPELFTAAAEELETEEFDNE